MSNSKKSFTAFPLQGYWGKLVGIYLSAIALILFFIFSFSNFILFTKYSQELHTEFSFLLLMYGLFMITFSKEKIDDERIKLIRGKSYQIGFMILIGSSLANTTVEVLTIDSETPANFISRYSYYVNITISLIFSIIYFHFSKWRDSDSTYSDGGPIDNIKYIKSKGFIGFAKEHPFKALKLILAFVFVFVFLAIYWSL